MTIRIRATEVQVGDIIDLENDAYADPLGDRSEFASQYYEVVEVTREGRNCIAIGFEGFDIVGFPAPHLLTLAERPAR